MSEAVPTPPSDWPPMPDDSPRARVRVANRKDGGYWFWLLRLYGFSACVFVAVGVVAAVSVYGSFANSTPATPNLRTFAFSAPSVTRMYAGDGTPLGEFAKEWREFVPFERIPPKLVEAFLAAEDHRFYSHEGIDVVGILRAVGRNVTSGDFSQGGSTITQQVAKQFCGSEKTLARKIREAIMARRLERQFSKQEILSFYLNYIFLGSGAYGVQAAARRYFSKNVDELDVGQMALVAGLAQAPSRDSPLGSSERAKKRRDVILDKMARHGYLSEAEAEKWKATSIELAPYKDPFLSTSPYFAEHVRRYLNKTYGPDRVASEGFQVETTVIPWLDGIAAENVDFGTRKQDRRQGWRGPEAHLEGEARQTFLDRAAQRYGSDRILPERRYLALVESVKESGAEVRIGHRLYKLPLSRMDWAAKWSTTNDVNDQKIGSAREALRAGDVIWVEAARHRVRKFSDWTLDEVMNARWIPEGEVNAKDDEVALAQVPHPQSALLTLDHQTGYVLAMIGGQDYARSELNRATQSCRQPGSTYKPIYYSLALDQGYGFDTALNDIPKAEVDPITGEVWTPENLHGTVETQVTLEYALVFSKNVPSVDIFKRVGAKNVEAWARRLGFTSPIIADRALALGASCTYMNELARAFSIFARNGRWIDDIYVRRVLDRRGAVLEDHTVYFDPMLPAAARLDRLAATAGDRPEQVIPARAAFLTSKLLRQMVREGYNGNLRQTGVISAGKTGTSSKTMDLWFVAYTSHWLTATWVGDDLRERQLGRDDASFMVAVPMWARYMYEATAGQTLAEIPWEVPEGVKPNDRGDNKGHGGDNSEHEDLEGVPKGIGSPPPSHGPVEEKPPDKT